MKTIQMTSLDYTCIVTGNLTCFINDYSLPGVEKLVCGDIIRFQSFGDEIYSGPYIITHILENHPSLAKNTQIACFIPRKDIDYKDKPNLDKLMREYLGLKQQNTAKANKK